MADESKFMQRKVEIELSPGQYLVEVHPSHPPRIWRHHGEGIFEGHGAKIRRVAIAYAFNELIAAAEKHEGIQ